MVSEPQKSSEPRDAAHWRSALEPVGLDYPAVAVKFTATEPVDMPRLDKKIALCAMLREAQESGPFYASKDEHGCTPGSFVLGQVGHDPVREAGRIGPEIGVYENTGANRRIYAEMTRFPEGSVPYTLFAPLEQLAFDPDLLVITATPSQAEVIVRAHGYKSGAAWEMRGTTVIGCSCLYAHPHFTGKMNILISGLHHGMRARNLFPMGLLLMSIPAPLIPEVTENLALMAERNLIDLPQYHWGKDYHEKYMRELAERLAREGTGEGN
ncbi:MAG: DUF169 domain-containing protein [Thermoleophilia bacterium]|nr:DUF169 domain-containing protein [Thermoleophilia bacterium]